jgi:hypothetical protein
MTEPARPSIPIDDAEIEDPDTALVEALRDSSHPERILRAQRMARQKVEALTERLRRRSTPPAGMRAVKR